jgi:hypothetical protein
MLVSTVARLLDCNPSTFTDKFGLPAPGSDKGRRDPVAGYFSALRDHVLTHQMPAESRRRVMEFLQRYGCLFSGESESAIRTTLRNLASAPPELARLEATRAAAALGNVPEDPARAALAVEVILAIRALPPDEFPGEVLQAELDAIDAFRVAAGRQWEWWQYYRIAERLPALTDSRTSYAVLALRAEAQARHGVALADVLRDAEDPDARARVRAAREVCVRLAAARGYADAGRLAEALEALPTAPSSDMTLATVSRLWHRAVVAGNDAVVAVLQQHAQGRFEYWTQSVTDENGQEIEDGPDFEDSAGDEGLALSATDEERLQRLATLASEQLTDETWRGWPCIWSLPETIEVLVHYLEAEGRGRPAQDVVADLFMAVGWGSSQPGTLSFSDAACCERLAAAYPEALEHAREAVPSIARATPVETISSSTRRLRHGSQEIPTGDFGRLLDAVLTGEIKLPNKDKDAIRQLGWLLDQRAARYLRGG